LSAPHAEIVMAATANAATDITDLLTFMGTAFCVPVE
jgi:hypothetical protein